MKDDLQTLRAQNWSMDEVLEVMPHLIVVRPWGLEGTYDIITAHKEPLTFYCDHNWDNTFGYAFGEIKAMGKEARRRQPDLKEGDFIHFTRCAYTDAIDKEGNKWLFVNWEDAIMKIESGEYEQDGTGKDQLDSRVIAT